MLADLPLWVVDIVRGFIVVGGVVVCGLFLSVMKQVELHRRYGMFALVLYAISAILRQFELWHKPLTHVTVFIVMGTIFGMMFHYFVFRDERRPGRKDNGIR